MVESMIRLCATPWRYPIKMNYRCKFLLNAFYLHWWWHEISLKHKNYQTEWRNSIVSSRLLLIVSITALSTLLRIRKLIALSFFIRIFFTLKRLHSNTTGSVQFLNLLMWQWQYIDRVMFNHLTNHALRVINAQMCIVQKHTAITSLNCVQSTSTVHRWNMEC